MTLSYYPAVGFVGSTSTFAMLLSTCAQTVKKTRTGPLLWLGCLLTLATSMFWQGEAFAQEQVIYTKADEVTCVAFSPDGKLLAIGGNNSVVWTWNLAKIDSVNEWRYSLNQRQGLVQSLSFAFDGSQLATSVISEPNDFVKEPSLFEAAIWDHKSAKHTVDFKYPKIERLVVSRDNQVVAFASRDDPGGTVIVVRLTDKKVLHRFSVDEAPKRQWYCRALAMSPDGTLVATNGSGDDVVLWSVPTGKRWTIEIRDGVKSLDFSADGKQLAVGSFESSVFVLEPPTADREPLIAKTFRLTPKPANFDPSKKRVNAVSLHPNGKFLATAGGISPNKVTVWNWQTGTKVATLGGHSGKWINDVQFSPDGKLIASGGGDGRVHVWRAPQLAKDRPLTAETDGGKYFLTHRKSSSITVTPGLIAKKRIRVHDEDLLFLSDHPSLKRLDLNGARINGDGLRFLASVKTLETLILSSSSVERLGALEDLDGLKSLSMQRVQWVKPAEWASLGELKQLRELDISDTVIGNDDLKFLSELKQLERLTMGSTWVDGGRLTNAALEHVRSLDRLRFLDVQGIDFTQRGFASLRSLESLEELDFRGFSVEGVREAQLGRKPKLKKLLLGRINDATLRQISAYKTLQSVEFRGHDCTDAGIAYLSELPNLKHVVVAHYWTPVPIQKYIAQLPKMPRDERAVYSTVRHLGRLRKEVENDEQDLRNARTVLPILIGNDGDELSRVEQDKELSTLIDESRTAAESGREALPRYGKRIFAYAEKVLGRDHASFRTVKRAIEAESGLKFD